MRGKLRDKPSHPKWNRMKREVLERRRPSKRENQVSILHNQHLEEEEYQPEDNEDALVAVEEIQK